MRTDVEILPIAEEHIEGFYNCLDIVARERIYLALINAPSLESVRSFVLSNISNQIPQYVAIIDNKVIGWCDISPRKQEGFGHCGELGMGVHPQYRRMGIGKLLAIHTIKKAKEIGVERIELEVFASNIPAITLYENIGFTPEGRKKKARKLDGKYDDVIEMAFF
jgi:RimJ/RimL family protein N-acetyltransferase